MADEQFKRNIAYKFRISDLSKGNPNFDNERFSFLELNGKKIIRVNLIGSIVDKYISEGEKKFLFLTLDDGSGQTKLKSFGDDSEKFKGFLQGQTVVVIGILRFFNNEIYVSPEIIRETDPKYLLVRKLELEKNENNSKTELRTENVAKYLSLRDNIIELIKTSESNGGIDLEKISHSVNSPNDLIKQEINKLLEEGIIFEPRPGVVRWLG